MRKRPSAVSVAGDGLVVNVIYFFFYRTMISWKLAKELGQIGAGLDLRKGPPSAGRLDSLTWNRTPVPSGLETAWTEPCTLPPPGYALEKKASLGRLAINEAPAGLSSTVAASPSFCGDDKG